MQSERQFLEADAQLPPREVATQRIRRDQTPQEMRTPSPVENILESNDVTTRKELGGGVNRAEIIELQDDGKAIFKSKKNEIEGRESGTLFKRERAAYLVDKFLGFEMIPETAIREVDGDIGSVQRFVSDTRMGYELPEEDQDQVKVQLNKLWVLDYILWNQDRHGGNFLVDQNNQVVAIDHRLTFSAGDFLPYHSLRRWEFPQGTVQRVIALSESQEMKRVLSDLLRELLSSEEVSACIKRIDNLAKALKSEVKPEFPTDWAQDNFS